MLEYAFAIPETACFVAHRSHLSAADFHPFYGQNIFFYFYPISTNILHRSGSDGARDEGKVLHATPILRHTMHDESMPVFARADFQRHGMVVFLNDLFAMQLHLHDQSIVIFGEQDVAAAA